MTDLWLEKLLTKLGLDNAEVTVFSTCYQHGELSVASIARILGISRSTVHGIVARLEASGLLTANQFSTTTLYQSKGYDDLLAYAHMKQQEYTWLIAEFEEQKEYLQGLYETRISAPIITYYSAQELNTRMYDKILSSEHVRSIRDIDRGKHIFGLDIQQIMKLPRISPGITQRILVNSPLAQRYVNLHQSDKYQLKLLPEWQGEKSDLMIMEGSVYHGSYVERRQWFQVTEPVFYNASCLMFDALRNSLEFPI